ncbi:hypothetical protein MHBO_002817 [Bonamia ostreae]|uniref:Uncharacterized protein n=1 Tax=Bonamia ostreae TaxID=126728 RepID=A0ABV2APD3_9EUKA
MPSSGNFGSTLQNSENIAKNDNTKNYISAPTDFPSLSQTQTFPFNINAKSFDSGNDKTKSLNAKSAFEQNDFGTIPSNSPWSQNVGNSAFGNEGDNKSVLSAFSFGNFRNGDNIFGNFDGNNDKKNEDNNADIFKNFIGSNVNTGEDNSGDKNDDREEGQLIEDKVKDFLIGEIKDDVIGGNNSSSSEEKIEDFEEIDGVKYKKWEIEQFAAENDFDCVPITFPVENVVWKNFV